MTPGPDEIRTAVKAYADELVAVRRDLHAHPELGRAEVRTTRVLRQRLERAGLHPRVLPAGTGLVCDLGLGSSNDEAPSAWSGPPRIVALRADIDALPVPDEKDVPYRSRTPDACHACGHDVHTAMLLGTGLVLADLEREGRLPGPVRLIFQPAEETTPGGALDVLAAGGLDGVQAIYALHCDPRTDVGEVGLRAGAITGAADQVTVRLRGPGGHTARPHLTADLVYALAKIVTDVPAALSRRVDPRSGLSLVWGRIAAGVASNAIPQSGVAAGTVRCLDLTAWESAPEIIEEVVTTLARIYQVDVEVDYRRGVPPVVNDEGATRQLRAAVHEALGAEAETEAEQSLGGEDFGWYLDRVPGAMARLGVRRPGADTVRDLHQGVFDVDESAIPIGVRVLTTLALLSFR